MKCTVLTHSSYGATGICVLACSAESGTDQAYAATRVPHELLRRFSTPLSPDALAMQCPVLT
eukprot:2210522-Rhodomonas_salina.2